MEKLFDKINDNERNLILKEFEAATLNYKKNQLVLSSVKANIIGKIDSVVNPKSGYIKANNIDKIVLDDPKINKNEIKIEVDQ